MARRILGLLAITAVSNVSAFRDTSPFMLFSTSDIPFALKNSVTELAQSSDLAQDVKNSLSKCPTQTYFVVQQNGVSSGDYAASSSAPYLSQSLKRSDKSLKVSVVVPEVLGEPSKSISEYLASQCQAQVVKIDGSKPDLSHIPSSSPRIIEVHFAALPTTGRSSKLAEHDRVLQDLVHRVGHGDYTVVYTTTPQSEEQVEATYQAEQIYQMEDSFSESVNIELKRDVGVHTRASKKEGGLFERYQYLSPGIFMALVASFPLFLIIYVGVTAIAGLEVSYFAFSKEMGPSQQRKQG